MTIILIAVIIWLLISKPKAGVLNCGLFGFCGNRELDERILDKLKILGFMNQVRGEDSTGVYNGEWITKGVDKEKRFFEFAMSGKVELPENHSKIFIGHCRKASIGALSIENAHPFNVNDRLIIAHNGTIENIWTLMYQADLSTTNVSVDSLGLGMLIDKLGYKILADYRGAAALIMHYPEEPDTLHIYHGKSRTARNFDPSEERPLFYYQADEGIYISSLRYSLEWINGGYSEEKIHTVPYNKVLTISNGIIDLENVYEVDRDDANLPVEHHYVPPAPPLQPPYGKVCKDIKDIRKLLKKEPDITFKNINLETLPKKALGRPNSIYYWKGRYWNTESHDLCNGIMRINKRGEQVPWEDTVQKRVSVCHFVRGILIKNEKEYEAVTLLLKNPHSVLSDAVNSKDGNLARSFSWYSRYPITNIGMDSAECPTDRNAWFSGGHPIEHSSLTPAFCDRTYRFSKGYLIGVSGPDSPFFHTEEEKKKSCCGVPPKAEGDSPIIDTTVEWEEYPEEVMDYVSPFRVVYPSYEKSMGELEGIPYFGLEEYAEDLCQMVLNVDPTPDLMKAIIDELILSAVFKKCTIEDILEPQLNSIESYVFDAYQDWEQAAQEELGEEYTPFVDVKKDDDDDGIMDKVKEQKEVLFAKAQALRDIEDEINRVEPGNYTFNGGGKLIKLFEDNAFDKLNEGYNVDDDETKADEDEQAKDIIKDDILFDLEKLAKHADELQVLNASKFALDCYHEIEIGIDSFKSCLKGLADKYMFADLHSAIAKSESLI